MSGGHACRCEESTKPTAERLWVVLQRNCNHSAFNGWHQTPSRYSEIGCRRCGSRWRTRAAYVNALNDSTHRLGAIWWIER